MLAQLIGYVVWRTVFLSFYILVTSPVFIAFAWVTEFMEKHQAPRILMIGWGIVGLSLFLGLLWMAHQTANHITFENKNFLKAITATLSEARVRLSFLPIIGNWFIKSDHENGADRDWDKD